MGWTITDHFEKLQSGISGITFAEREGWNQSDVYLSKITALPGTGKLNTLFRTAIDQLAAGIDPGLLHSDQTICVISSAKGDLDADLNHPFQALLKELVTAYQLKHAPVVISNACVSGVMAINYAAALLASGKYAHAIVLGGEVISQFVLYGFQALFAVGDRPCRPFDRSRNGVTLGEGSAGVVLSREASVFKEKPLQYLGGASSNDANHISGPSRTGEGLYRSVSKTLQRANVKPEAIGYISAHGTGTVFNDEMEAIAFNRLGLEGTPVNSLKGYWGHTLGAAGVMEVALAMQSLRKELLVASMGYSEPGTTQSLTVLTSNQPLTSPLFLKTASGFGGCNASLIIRKI